MLVKLNSLLVFSENNKKYFYTKFSDGINIVKGKNTSGKSTLIQSIVYSLGINGGNEKLQEILDEQLLFRLDLERSVNGVVTLITFIREGESFFIYEEGKNGLRFDGINSDNSNEHIKLKKVISAIFGFGLVLESNEELKEAPLEAMLLPYYISQSVGWVYLRESFSGLNFYKNFKLDYLDYYLGITTDVDRIKLHKLLKQKLEVIREIDFLNKMKVNDEKLQLSRLLDEEFKAEAMKYLKEYSALRERLVKEETNHISLCNSKSLAANRELVLKKIKRHIIHQQPEIDACPVCIQILPSSLETVYSHQQNLNDTVHEINLVKAKVTDFQSKINSVFNKIQKINEIIESKYSVIKNYESANSTFTFDTWLNHKSNVKLIENIDKLLAEKAIELAGIIGEIKEISVDDDIQRIRNVKERQFLTYFQNYLSELNVSILDEPRYKLLYRISSFPFQGVELHKTVMAYHFALNKLISKTIGIHRFPFILDAVMKEDIDEDNRIKIFSFLNKNSPRDTQMIFSISESLSHSKDDDITTNNINLVNEKYFSGKGNVIQIGDGDSERSFLVDYNDEYNELIRSTLEMTNLA